MNHRQTRIHRRSLELIALCQDVTRQLPRGQAHLVDQLRRASSSIALNFGEGSSRRSARERRRYFDIARGSALELASALDVAAMYGSLDSSLHARGIDLCDHLSAMLFKWR